MFVASFSKAIVLEIYSGFINNFSVAMDLAKMEAKRKSALADFFKVNFLFIFANFGKFVSNYTHYLKKLS